MRYFVIFFVIGFFGVFLESTLVAAWPSQTLRLELVWVLLLYAAFSWPLTICGALAIALGFMTDLAGTPFLGLFASIYFVTVVILRAFIAQMFIETLWARLLWIGIFTLLASVMEWGLLECISRAEGLRNYLLVYTVPQCLFNMVLAAFLLPLLDRVNVLMTSSHGA